MVKGLALLLTGSAVACGQPEGQPEQESPYTVERLRQIEECEFSEVYCDMKRDVEQAYTLTLRLQDFSWRPYDSLSWESVDEQGAETVTLMSEVLPAAEAVKPLSAQCDKCNALTVKAWLKSPYEGPETPLQEAEKLMIAQLRVLCRQLESELGEAKHQVNKLKSDINNQFADIEHSLSISTSLLKESYLETFRGRCAEYIDLLDEVMLNLEQAEQAASELRRWKPN